ncbi:MAG: TonB-dependent receptor plug domain-containing protein [Caldimicrobium sp.]
MMRIKEFFGGKVIIISLFLRLTSLGYAEDNFYQLEEVKITAHPLAEPLERASQEIKILKKEELTKYGLSRISSLDLRERGGFGVQEDLSFRGTTFEQNLVLFEGIKITDLQTSHHLMNLPFTENNLEAIEVLSGGASPFYGSGGFGGVLNFLLEPSKGGFNFKVSTGSYDYRDLEIKAGLPLLKEKFLNFQFSQRKAQGFIWNRDFDIRNFNLYHKDSQTTFFYGFQEKDFGARNFYTPKYDSEWEETRTHLLLAKKLINIRKLLFEPAILYRKNYDLYLLDRRNPTFYKNRHETYLYRIRLPLSLEWKENLFGFGFEGSYEEWEGLLRTGQIRKELLRREYSFFAFFKPKIGDNLFPSLQIRYDLHSKEKDFLSFGGGISYLLHEGIKSRFSFNYSYRLPSATELFYDSLGIRGNPELSSEKAINLETGLDLSQKSYNLSFTLFYRKGWKLIDWVFNGSHVLAENLDLKTIGFTWDLKKELRGHSLIISYTYLNQVGANLNFARYHGNYMRHNLVMAGDFKLPYQINLVSFLNYQKRFSQKGIVLLNLEIRKKISDKLRLSLWGKNLFDETYYEIRYAEAKKGVLGIPQWIGFRVEGGF